MFHNLDNSSITIYNLATLKEFSYGITYLTTKKTFPCHISGLRRFFPKILRCLISSIYEVNPFRSQHFKHIDKYNIYRIEPWNSIELRGNRKFRSILFRHRNRYNGNARFMSRILDQLKVLIELTQKEISKLEN